MKEVAWFTFNKINPGGWIKVNGDMSLDGNTYNVRITLADDHKEDEKSNVVSI